MKYDFNIADIKICIMSSFEIDWNDYIHKFLCGPLDNYDEYYELIVTNSLIPEGKMIYQSDFQYIFKNDELEERLHFFFGHSIPCMMYKEYDDKKVIYLNEYYLPSFKEKNNYSIFNALAFEKVLIKHHAIVLHCSYIIYHDKAILFSAPSGTGKSTQADLWKKYRNAEIVNGDRAIIKKSDDTYYAMGMPICGSSNICLNKSAPIRAIVYLGQSPNNHIQMVDKKTQIKKTVSETTINFFNHDFLDDAISIITDLSLHVPMYELLCTKDIKAIECLERMLDI